MRPKADRRTAAVTCARLARPSRWLACSSATVAPSWWRTAALSSSWRPSMRRRGSTSRILASSSPSWTPHSTWSIAVRPLQGTSAPVRGHVAM
ncbi:MAG: hypothetical protein R3F14_05085 [Polyangiaceae bacterium]